MPRMSTLEQDLGQERRRLEDLCARARNRLTECQTEAASLQAQGASTASDGDTRGAAEFERRAQKARAQARRYEEVVQELETGGARLAAEVLLARLSGPETDQLTGEVDRSRELIVQRATALLRARDRHRALRHRWTELNDKIRVLREERGLPAPRVAAVDFRVVVTPGTYAQQPDGPTYREVSELLHELGL